jgi:hypothetical protein
MNFSFSELPYVDLLSVGIAVAGMVLLGFAVLFNNVRSLSNQVFFYLALASGLWGIINYFSYQPYPLDVAFFASSHCNVFCGLGLVFYFYIRLHLPLNRVKVPSLL